MNEEAGFLSVIRHAPADETARLVYSDWLEEQGGPEQLTKAEFLRSEPTLELDDPERLRQLACVLSPEWLATVSRPLIAGCRLRLIRPCPGRWNLLASFGDSAVRTCDTCQKSIRFCTTFADARALMVRGEPAAISPAEAEPAPGLTRGLPFPLYPRSTTPALLPRVRVRTLCRPAPPKQSRHQHAAANELAEPQSDEIRWGLGQQRPLPKRRKGGRGRNRNIQRGEWEE